MTHGEIIKSLQKLKGRLSLALMDVAFKRIEGAQWEIVQTRDALTEILESFTEGTEGKV